MRLGEMLIERRLITPDDLERGLEIQKERDERIGKILVDLGFVALRDVMAALSDQLGVPQVSLESPPPVTPETEGLTPKFLRQFKCMPSALDDSTLTLAMADPLDFETISVVKSVTGLKVKTALATEQEILDAIEKYYGEEKVQETVRLDDPDGQQTEDLEHLRDMASEAPVIRLVNTMVAQAVEKRASDIHIEPFEKDFRIRFRIDGVSLSSGAASARVAGRGHLTRQANGEAQHRRTAAATGWPALRSRPSAAKSTCAFRRCRLCMGKAS